MCCVRVCRSSKPAGNRVVTRTCVPRTSVPRGHATRKQRCAPHAYAARLRRRDVEMTLDLLRGGFLERFGLFYDPVYPRI